MQRMIGPGLLGVIGVAILITLGVWQLERLKWKEAKLAAIDAMLVDAPVALPAAVTMAADRYRGVTVEGSYSGETVLKLDSLQGQGPGKRRRVSRPACSVSTPIRSLSSRSRFQLLTGRGTRAGSRRNRPTTRPASA